MEFDKSRVFTCVNAEEVKIGSKVIIADSLGSLKRLVELGDKANIHKLIKIYDCNTQHRFRVDNGYNCEYALCYLVEEPAGLKWTDLKIGDVIRNKELPFIKHLITGIDEGAGQVFFCNSWTKASELEEWEKVENEIYNRFNCWLYYE